MSFIILFLLLLILIDTLNGNIPKQSNFITPSKSFVAQWSGHAIAGQCVDFGAMSVPTNAVIYGAFFTPWANITQSINLYYAGGHVYCYSPAYTGNVGYSALVFYTV